MNASQMDIGHTATFGTCRVVVTDDVALLIEPFGSDAVDARRAEAYVHALTESTDNVSQFYADTDRGEKDAWVRVYACP